MPTKKQTTPQTDYVIQESINGIDALGRDRMIIVRGQTPADFFDKLAALKPEIAEIVAGPTKYQQRAPRESQPAQHHTAAPNVPAAPVVPGLVQPTEKCPNGHLVYNNITDPSRKPNSPLVRCPDCNFRVWSAPRTDVEKQYRAWWEEKYGVIK